MPYLMRHPALAAVAFLTALSSFWVEASLYPPNMSLQRECQQEGPLEVCAINKNYRIPRLSVKYTGYLHTESPGKVSAWVQLNSRSGTFRLSDFKTYQYKEIGDIQNVTCCFSYDPPPKEESAIFFYAFDQNGKPNAWDVEVALFNDEEKWDSKYGANYKFRV